jgi:hypothetical protein
MLALQPFSYPEQTIIALVALESKQERNGVLIRTGQGLA